MLSKFLQFFSTSNAALIFVNGSRPSKRLIDFLDPLVDLRIACDGAYNLVGDNFVDVVIGDFDSIKKNIKSDIKRIKICDQNSSDLDKAIELLIRRGYQTAHVLGLAGDKFDHIFYNFKLLKKSKDRDLKLYFWMPTELVFIADSRLDFKSMQDFRLSFFALPEASIATKGLKYNIQADFYTSLSNLIIADHASIDVQTGRLIIFIEHLRTGHNIKII